MPAAPPDSNKTDSNRMDSNKTDSPDMQLTTSKDVVYFLTVCHKTFGNI